jgi:restriction system protein
LTNVQLTSLADLKSTASRALGMAQLRAIQGRALRSRERYWDLDKSVRIKYGLRPDFLEYGYSADSVMKAIEAALFSAFGQRFPIECSDPIGFAMIKIVDEQIFSAATPIELSELLEPLIADLENRLDTAYAAIEQGANQN